MKNIIKKNNFIGLIFLLILVATVISPNHRLLLYTILCPIFGFFLTFLFKDEKRLCVYAAISAITSMLCLFLYFSITFSGDPFSSTAMHFTTPINKIMYLTFLGVSKKSLEIIIIISLFFFVSSIPFLKVELKKGKLALDGLFIILAGSSLYFVYCITLGAYPLIGELRGCFIYNPIENYYYIIDIKPVNLLLVILVLFELKWYLALQKYAMKNALPSKQVFMMLLFVEGSLIFWVALITIGAYPMA